MQAAFERADLLGVRVDLFLLEIGFFAANAHDARGNAHDRRMRRDFFEDDRACADLRAFAHGKAAQDLRARRNDDVLFDGRVALALFLARAAQRHALINDDAALDFRRFADDNAHAVIDEHASLDLRRRVDLDARQKFGELRDHARQQFQVHFIQSVCKPVPRERVYPRIGQPDLEFVARGGVVALCRFDVRA